jgi:inosine-uridine nucleoside N-ribohydrolase
LDPIMRYARFAEEDVEQLEASGQPWCLMASRLMRSRLKRWKGPISPPDVAAMGVAIDPTIAVGQDYSVVIETKGEHTRGMTVVDRRRWREMLGSEPNVHVVEEMDTSKYRELFVSTLLRE